MRHDDDAWLLDMHQAAMKARDFVQDLSKKEFVEDERTQYAVLRCLEIIGEAGRNVSQERQQQLGDLPWSGVRGLRNRIAHEYFNINLDIVWSIVSDELADLIRILGAVIPPPPAEHIEGDG